MIGHIRRLPRNFHASAEARAHCLQDIGIELAETGETYVREHLRGIRKEDNPRGHRALFAVGETAVRATVPGPRPSARVVHRQSKKRGKRR